jgi:hypothetical protein
MKQLSNNSELHQYLVALEAVLRKHGAVDLADAIGSACRLASGLSTEFLGESRIALRQVSMQRQTVLTEQERRDLRDVLKQLDAALDQR